MKLSNMTTEQILYQYPDLPQRLLSYFASQCAKDVISLIKDPRSLAAIDMAERYGLGCEDISQEERTKVADNASAAAYAAYDASYAAYYAAYAAASAAYAADAANAASAAAYAANAAYAAASAASNAASYAATRKEKELQYRDLLITLINTKLTGFERLMIGIIT